MNAACAPARLDSGGLRRVGVRGAVDEAVYALTDEEREQVQLALYLRDRAQGNALATALVDPTLDDDDRERATALLLTLATEPTAAAPSVDSYEYALARTRDVMQRVGGAVHANSAFMRFDGHVVGERAAEDADERLRFQREADPFAWIIEHAADSDGWGWPDFEDAWGNRLRFVYGYNGERVWRLVSAGPDGQLDPLDREGPLDDIVAPFRWSGS